jgi:hypothetical protein
VKQRALDIGRTITAVIKDATGTVALWPPGDHDALSGQLVVWRLDDRETARHFGGLVANCGKGIEPAPC